MMERLQKIKPYLPWALLVLIALLTWQWTHARRALLDAQRSAEAAELALKNQIVEGQETRRQLQGTVGGLLSENAGLRAAYDRAKEAAPDAKPVSASRLDTGPLRVQNAPRGKSDPTTEPQAVPPSGPAAPVVSNSCLLQPEDQLSVEALVLELQTGKENTLVVGAATVYRDTPAPRVAIATGEFRSSLSNSNELEAPPPPRWGVEVVGLCVSQGCGLGGGVLLPPFRVPLLGWRGEARADAYAGPALGASAALGVRW
jgi:hypothetical protein